jgi:hypothetical protein
LCGARGHAAPTEHGRSLHADARGLEVSPGSLLKDQLDQGGQIDIGVAVIPNPHVVHHIGESELG